MRRLWLILGFVALGLGLFGYLDQELRCKAHWDWSQFLHHESFIAIAICVGIALLVVYVVERRGLK